MTSLRIGRTIFPLQYKSAIKATHFSLCGKYVCLNNPTIGNIINKRNINSNRNSILSSEKWSIENKLKPKTTQLNVLDGLLKGDDEYLDKLMSHLASDITEKNRIYKNDLMSAISKYSNRIFIKKRESILLIKCCSNLLLDEKPASRMTILENVLEILRKAGNFDIDHYNEILKCYIDNNYKFLAHNFIESMAPYKPTELTYQLMITAVCQMGDMNQANELIVNMKNSKIPISESVYNVLIEGHGRAGNISAAQELIHILISNSTEISLDTKKSLIKAYIYSGDKGHVEEQLKSDSLIFTESQASEIMHCLVQNNMNSLLPVVISSLPAVTKENTMSKFLQNFCMLLIHQGYLMAAYEIYTFWPAFNTGAINDTSILGRILLRECIKSSNNLDEFLYIINGLIHTERNKQALYIAFEAAIHYGKPKMAIEFLKVLKKRGDVIRPHFFWPLLVSSSNESGETGIFEILSLMASLEVSPDYDTFVDYVLPQINLALPEDVVKKFKQYNISSSDCVTPILLYLIKNKRESEASELCELTNCRIDCEPLIFPLLLNYLTINDVNSVHNILKAFQDKAKYNDRDWIGKFLATFVSYRKWDRDIGYFKNLILVLSESDTKISAQAVDICLQYFSSVTGNEADIKIIKNQLSEMIDNRFVNDQCLTTSFGKSQASMSIKELEAHAIELESKEMNTRGVLRKLLQNYCRNNDFKEATKILKKCEDNQVVLSAGMKASLMELFLQNNDLKKADFYYQDLKKYNKNFTLDDYKVLDYATVLIANNEYNRAINILKDRANSGLIKGGKNIETNCWKLLNALSEKGDFKRTDDMLNLLLKLGYCKISNILLGPLIRVHLNNSNIPEAVKEFSFLAEKYRKTPLKQELLCILIRNCTKNDNVNQENTNDNVDKKKTNDNDQIDYKKLLIQVQSIERKIHGVTSSQISFITALAVEGVKKPLRKFLLDPSTNVRMEDILNQCNRFVSEKNSTALETLAECTEGVKNFHVEEIYEMIFKLYSLSNNYEATLKLWYEMENKNIKLTKNTIEIVTSTLKSNKQTIPLDLLSQLSDEKRASLTSN